MPTKTETMTTANLGTPQPEKTQSPSVTEGDMLSMRNATKAALDAQPRKQIRLHKLADKHAPNYETVQINGHLIQIMRGVEVDVPQTVYDILEEAGLL